MVSRNSDWQIFHTTYRSWEPEGPWVADFAGNHYDYLKTMTATGSSTNEWQLSDADYHRQRTPNSDGVSTT